MTGLGGAGTDLALALGMELRPEQQTHCFRSHSSWTGGDRRVASRGTFLSTSALVAVSPAAAPPGPSSVLCNLAPVHTQCPWASQIPCHSPRNTEAFSLLNSRPLREWILVPRGLQAAPRSLTGAVSQLLVCLWWVVGERRPGRPQNAGGGQGAGTFLVKGKGRGRRSVLKESSSGALTSTVTGRPGVRDLWVSFLPLVSAFRVATWMHCPKPMAPLPSTT